MATATQTPPARLVAGRRVTDQARSLLRQTPLAATSVLSLSVADRDGSIVAVPAELTSLLRQVVQIVADGGAVTIGSLPDELTTTAAAAQLGVSRPTLARLVGAGEIPAHKVGSHTRFRTEDVIAYRRARLARQRAALQELIHIEDELENSGDSSR